MDIEKFMANENIDGETIQVNGEQFAEYLTDFDQQHDQSTLFMLFSRTPTQGMTFSSDLVVDNDELAMMFERMTENSLDPSVLTVDIEKNASGWMFLHIY